MADELPVEPEPAHVDFLRRMAEIDQDYDQHRLPAGDGAPADVEAEAETEAVNVVDFRAARQRLRP